MVAHYDIFTIATRGARRLGEKRTNVYSKKYSSKETFITWASRIRSFLERSSVSKSDESNEILNYMQCFRGFGEEAKLGKLYSMLCALYDNWDLLSQVNGMAIRREKERPWYRVPLRCDYRCYIIIKPGREGKVVDSLDIM